MNATQICCLQIWAWTNDLMLINAPPDSEGLNLEKLEGILFLYPKPKGSLSLYLYEFAVHKLGID